MYGNIKSNKSINMKTPFFQSLHMVQLNYMHTISLKFIKMHMICIYVMEFLFNHESKRQEKIFLSHKKLFCLQNNTIIPKRFS